MMALCRSPESAERVGAAMREAFVESADLEARLFLSPVSSRGARLVHDRRGAL
jgi:hypothetical protein